MEQILRIPIKYGELFQTMNNEEAGKLLKALFVGKDEGLDGLTLTYYNIIIVDINNLYNSVINGKKGGRPKIKRGVLENKKGGFEKVKPIESKVKENKTNKSNINKSNYGEFKNVKLTLEEYNNLVIRYDELDLKKLITKLDLYIGQVGNKYKSHYLTIINWGKKEGIKEYTKKERDILSQKEKKLKEARKTNDFEFLEISEEKKKENLKKLNKMKQKYFNNK